MSALTAFLREEIRKSSGRIPVSQRLLALLHEADAEETAGISRLLSAIRGRVAGITEHLVSVEESDTLEALFHKLEVAVIATKADAERYSMLLAKKDGS